MSLSFSGFGRKNAYAFRYGEVVQNANNADVRIFSKLVRDDSRSLFVRRNSVTFLRQAGAILESEQARSTLRALVPDPSIPDLVRLDAARAIPKTELWSDSAKAFLESVEPDIAGPSEEAVELLGAIRAGIFRIVQSNEQQLLEEPPFKQRVDELMQLFNDSERMANAERTDTVEEKARELLSVEIEGLKQDIAPGNPIRIRLLAAGALSNLAQALGSDDRAALKRVENELATAAVEDDLQLAQFAVDTISRLPSVSPATVDACFELLRGEYTSVQQEARQLLVEVAKSSDHVRYELIDIVDTSRPATRAFLIGEASLFFKTPPSALRQRLLRYCSDAEEEVRVAAIKRVRSSIRIRNIMRESDVAFFRDALWDDTRSIAERESLIELLTRLIRSHDSAEQMLKAFISDDEQTLELRTHAIGKISRSRGYSTDTIAFLEAFAEDKTLTGPGAKPLRQSAQKGVERMLRMRELREKRSSSKAKAKGNDTTQTPGISDEELKRFAAITQELRTIKQAAEKEMITTI